MFEIILIGILHNNNTMSCKKNKNNVFLQNELNEILKECKQAYPSINTWFLRKKFENLINKYNECNKK